MPYGPFELDNLRRATLSASSPGEFTLGAAGLLYTCRYGSGKGLFALQGDRAFREVSPDNKALGVVLPMDRIEVAIGAAGPKPEDVSWPTGWLAVTPEHRVMLAANAESTFGGETYVVLDLLNGEALQQWEHPERWTWVPEWTLFAINDARHSRYELASFLATAHPQNDA